MLDILKLKPAEEQKVEAASHFVKGMLLLEQSEDAGEGINTNVLLERIEELGIDKKFGRYALWHLMDTGVARLSIDQLALAEPPATETRP